jgi:hypothetical protein
MRAKFIYEFERGLDPKAALGIGPRIFKIRKCFRDLNIPDEDYVITPTEVIFNSSLYLVGKNVTWLPNNLRVNVTLYLTNALITELPEDLQVDGNLYLRNATITKLPKNLKVGNHLWLNNTKITKLPKGLYVGWDLDLEGTAITELPDDLQVGLHIWASPHQKKLIAFIQNSMFKDKLIIKIN